MERCLIAFFQVVGGVYRPDGDLVQNPAKNALLSAGEPSASIATQREYDPTGNCLVYHHLVPKHKRGYVAIQCEHP